jgi:hypothetical protein
MSVATQYFNYQQAPVTDPHYGKGVSPAIVDLREYVMKQYGGINLGDYGIRPIRGGTAPSTHAFGAAWDWRYMNADQTGLLGRARMLNEVMPWMISHSQELGIQMIGDYIGCRIWKADRSGDVNGGWKVQTPDSHGMGQKWAGWLHIEVNPRVWADGRTIEEKLGVQGWPPFAPEQGLFSLYPWNTAKPAIRLGAQGDLVRYMQGVMKFKLGYGITVDGGFGNVTLNFVRWYQGSKGLTVDGVVGAKTWAALDADAKR